MVSVLYVLSVLPGIELIDRLSVAGKSPTGFELYQTRVMEEHYRQSGGAFLITIVYMCSVFLPAKAWSIVILITGTACLCKSKLKYLNIIVVPLLLISICFFWHYVYYIEKISTGLE